MLSFYQNTTRTPGFQAKFKKPFVRKPLNFQRKIPSPTDKQTTARIPIKPFCKPIEPKDFQEMLFTVIFSKANTRRGAAMAR